MPDIDIKIVRHDDRPAWPDLNDNPNIMVASDSWGLAALEGGMTSGKHSVALRLEIPGVGTVIAETSMNAWIGATAAMRGAYPEAFADSPFALAGRGYLWKQGGSMPDKTVVYQDKAGEWRWKRVAPNGEIIADSGEGYTRLDDAEQAAERVFGTPDDQP